MSNTNRGLINIIRSSPSEASALRAMNDAVNNLHYLFPDRERGINAARRFQRTLLSDIRGLLGYAPAVEDPKVIDIKYFEKITRELRSLSPVHSFVVLEALQDRLNGKDTHPSSVPVYHDYLSKGAYE